MTSRLRGRNAISRAVAVAFMATSYLKMATSMIEANRANSFLSCTHFEGCTCASVFSQKVQIPTGYGMEDWATVTFNSIFF